MENAIIIFVRNAEKGKVKTRLAKDLGDEQTLAVYRYLLQHTSNVARPCNSSHFVFYSSYVHVQDVFDDELFTKFVQEGDDLGERMKNACKKVFDLGCKKICIIGSDCFELQTEILEQAFEALDTNEVVIGPAHDGGYYLLGMTSLHNELFAGINWGTSTVYDDSIDKLQQKGVAYYSLVQLNDIDTIDDLLETNILANLQEQSFPGIQNGIM